MQQEEYIQYLIADFRNFLFHLWTGDVLRLPPPTDVQYLIARHVADSSIRRRGIEGYRGVGKSWITSAYCLWRLLKDPQLNILVVSGSKNRADDFSTFCHKLILEQDILKHLVPDSTQRFRQDKWDVKGASASHSANVTSVGVFGMFTGSRADLIIGDDCETPKNSTTEDQREKLLGRMVEFESVIKPGGEIVLLGTPQTVDSVYNKFGERNYDIRVFPARYPKANKVAEHPGLLAPELTEQLMADPDMAARPTDPKRYNDVELREREATYGRAGWMLQFMLDTTLSDAERYPLRTRDLIVMPVREDQGPVSVTWGSRKDLELDLPNVGLRGDRLYAPFQVSDKYTDWEGSVMAIDPSGRGKDETGYAVVKQLHGKLFCTECGGLSGGYDEDVLKTLAIVAKRNAVNEVIIEPNYGDGMFDQLLKPVLNRLHPCVVSNGPRAVNQKELRIADVMEPIMNQHRLIVDQKMLEDDLALAVERAKYSLIFQLTRLTRDRGALLHDDRLEALSMAVRYWVEYMARDDQQAEQEWHEEELDRQLEDFVENCLHVGGLPG